MFILIYGSTSTTSDFIYANFLIITVNEWRKSGYSRLFAVFLL